MPLTFEQRFMNTLVSMATPMEARQWLRTRDLQVIVYSLPADTVPAAEFFARMVELAQQHGVEQPILNILAEERPHRRSEIDGLRAALQRPGSGLREADGLFTGSADWQALAELLGRLADSLPVQPGPDERYNTEFVDSDEKDRLNGLVGDDAAEHFERFEPWFNRIEAFLRARGNEAQANRYFTTAHGWALRVGQRQRLGEPFGRILMELVETHVPVAGGALGHEALMLQVMVAHMYRTCLLGRRTAAERRRPEGP